MVTAFDSSVVFPRAVCFPKHCLVSIHTTLPPPVRGVNVVYADDVTQIVGYGGKSLATASAIEEQTLFEKQWKIKTNRKEFSIIRLGSKNTEDHITTDDTHETKTKGKILRITITRHGYCDHVTNMRQYASSALSKLYRFRHFTVKLKIQQHLEQKSN